MYAVNWPAVAEKETWKSFIIDYDERLSVELDFFCHGPNFNIAHTLHSMLSGLSIKLKILSTGPSWGERACIRGS